MNIQEKDWPPLPPPPQGHPDFVHVAARLVPLPFGADAAANSSMTSGNRAIVPPPPAPGKKGPTSPNVTTHKSNTTTSAIPTTPSPKVNLMTPIVSPPAQQLSPRRVDLSQFVRANKEEEYLSPMDVSIMRRLSDQAVGGVQVLQANAPESKDQRHNREVSIIPGPPPLATPLMPSHQREMSIPPPPPPAIMTHSRSSSDVPPPPADDLYVAAPVTVRAEITHMRNLSKQFPAPSCLPATSIDPTSHCDRCRMPIVDGKFVETCNKRWHSEHFICNGPCKIPLATSSYYMHEGQPYCMVDFETSLALRCKGCLKPVTEGIGTPELMFHSGCIKCCVCQKTGPQDISNATEPWYFNAKGDVFCETDFKAGKATVSKLTCVACKSNIQGQAAVLMEKHYHPHCVVCAAPDCGKVLGSNATPESGSNVYVSCKDNKLYCKQHLEEQSLATCDRCFGPISQAHGGIKVKEFHFHRECVACRTCNTPLYFGSAVYIDEIPRASKSGASSKIPIYPFCEPHYRQVLLAYQHALDKNSDAANACSICQQALESGLVIALNASRYHLNCLRCKICACQFPEGKGIFKDPHADTNDVKSFLCRTHYIEVTASKCNKCSQPIVEGKFVTQADNKFHAACFEGEVVATKANVIKVENP